MFFLAIEKKGGGNSPCFFFELLLFFYIFFFKVTLFTAQKYCNKNTPHSVLRS